MFNSDITANRRNSFRSRFRSVNGYNSTNKTDSGLTITAGQTEFVTDKASAGQVSDDCFLSISGGVGKLVLAGHDGAWLMTDFGASAPADALYPGRKHGCW